MLVNLIGRCYTGQDADEALGRANITVNKNAVPGDPRPPFVTSGLRLGTPAITTRGFDEADCRDLASRRCDVLDGLEGGEVEPPGEAVRQKVLDICRRHPVYR